MASKSAREIDALTFFIALMALASVAIGVWGIFSFKQMRAMEEIVAQERTNLKTIQAIIEKPDNKRFFGVWDVKEKYDVTPANFTSYLIETANSCGIVNVTMSSLMTTRRGDVASHSIEQRFQNVIFSDIIAYVLSVETNSASVKAKSISLSNFQKEFEIGVEPTFSSTVRFNIYTREQKKPAAPANQ